MKGCLKKDQKTFTGKKKKCILLELYSKTKATDADPKENYWQSKFHFILVLLSWIENLRTDRS